jgi:cytoskeletal protein CcmA (bactofilin family)
MKISKRLLLPALLLATPVSLAQTQDPAAPKAEARAQNTINVQFRGSLRDAIQKIAEAGGLNVVVTGDLDTPTEVRLTDINAELALRSVARAYSLKLDQDNGIYTLRPLTAEEKAHASAFPTPSMPPMPGMPPMPSVGPVPPVPPDVADEVAQSALDEDEVKERVREKMKQVRRSSRGSRDVVARGRSLEVKEGETVDSAVVYGGNLVVKGHVEDDAVVFGGNLEVTGHVEGDAHAFGGNVVLAPGAVVEGDVSSFGGSVLKQEGAKVEGSTESFGGANIGRMVAGEIKENIKQSKQQASRDDDEEREERHGNGFAGFLLTFAMLFGLGFLGQILFPARMKELGAEVRAQPVKDGLVGLLGALALIPATVVLTVTIIGIPLVLALMVVVPLVTALGFAAVASELGTRMPVLVGRKTQALVLALGLLILLVVGRIPVLGPLVLTLATLVALGAVIRTRFGHRPRGIPEPITSERVPL